MNRVVPIVAMVIVVGLLAFYFLSPNIFPHSSTVPEGVVVRSNDIVVAKVMNPGPGQSFSLGIWRMDLLNGAGSTAYVTYQINLNGNILVGNSTTIPPGQGYDTTYCFYDFIARPSYDTSLFIQNSTGLVSPHYPVTLVNATQAAFSGQFSVSNIKLKSTSNPPKPGNWSLTVTNTGSKSISYLYAELSNSSALLRINLLRCEGGTPFVPGFSPSYGQPLDPSQTANSFQFLIPYDSIHAGATCTVTVFAVYSDNSEVVQSYTVQADS